MYLRNRLPRNIADINNIKNLDLGITDRDVLLVMLKRTLEAEDYFKKLFLLFIYTANQKKPITETDIKSFIAEIRKNPYLFKDYYINRVPRFIRIINDTLFQEPIIINQDIFIQEMIDRNILPIINKVMGEK